MEISPRLRQILLVMLQQSAPMSVKDLAAQINVSRRTTQRELEYMDSSIKKYGLRLGSKTGTGIWIEGNEDEKKSLLEILQGEDVIDSADQKERHKYLTLEFLKDQTPKKLYYYANIFGVSETTVGKDIENIKPWFHQYSLNIVKKPGLGVYLEGSEKNYRKALREFIAAYVNTPFISEIYKKDDAAAEKSAVQKKIQGIYSLLNEEIFRRVCMCLESIQDERFKQFTEESYMGLVIHITIALERVQMGEIIEGDDRLEGYLEKDEEDLRLALWIVNSLEEEFDIDIPDIEMFYIGLHIKGSKLQNSDQRKLWEEGEYQRLYETVQEMIMVFDPLMANELSCQEDFVEALIAHLRPTFVRLRNYLSINNPHLAQIQKEYPDVYQRSEKVARFLEKKENVQIPPSEIGFFAIHFGAVLEKIRSEREKARVVNVGVVCASGIGISRLMASKLKSALKEHANITTYGHEELTPFVIAKNDFFVTSMDIENTEADIFHASPLLTVQDMDEIKKKVAQYAQKPQKQEGDKDFSEQLERVHCVSSRIREILNGYQLVKVSPEISFNEMILEVTKQITPYENHRECIQKDILRREALMTQIIPEMDFALLHTITKGVTVPFFGTCMTANGTPFQNEYFKGIHLIIFMVLPEDRNVSVNQQIMGHISESLVEYPEFLERLKTLDPEYVRGEIKHCLKQFFNSYLETL